MISGPKLQTATFGATGTIATLTVSNSGVFALTAFGAAGGGVGGDGFELSGDVTLAAGDVLEIIVGEKGATFGSAGGIIGGGGGGTFIYDQTTGILLEAAGGGGGGGWTGNGVYQEGASAVYGKTGGSGVSPSNLTGKNPGGAGGSNGGGGTAPVQVVGASEGAGGGGFSASGLSGTNGATGGTSFSGGGGGGGGKAPGGFGGGGGAAYTGYRYQSAYGAGGGGGGYSGGGGGGTGAGGGGGSSIFATSITNRNIIGAANLGNGVALLQQLTSGTTISSPVINPGTVFAPGSHTVVANPTIAGGTLALGAYAYVQGNISFTTTGGELLVEAPVGGVTLNPTDTITGFAAGDYIALPGAGLSAATSLTVTNAGTLSVITGSTTYDVLISGLSAGQNNFIYGAHGITETTHTLSSSLSTGISLTTAGPFLSGFTVTNTGTVMSGGNAISSTLAGAYLANQGVLDASAGIGVSLAEGSTLINTGTISGTAGAVYFSGTGNDTIIAGAGAVFSGAVSAKGADNTLALTGAGGTLGGSFTNFSAGGTAGSSWTLSGSLTGTDGAYGYTAGVAGGAGFSVAAAGLLTNRGTLTGGAGGQSHLQGGAGGSGANLALGGNLTNYGVIKGGDSSFAFAKTGATALAGGDGVVLGSGAVATNSGTITGGLGGFVYASNGTGGAGGAGAYVNGGTLINFGTISGGAGRTGGAQGDAVQFGTAASTLIFTWPGTFIGQVAGNGVNDTLALDGLIGTLSQLGSQFTGFSALVENSSAYWTLTSNFTGGAGAYGFSAGGAGTAGLVMQAGGRANTHMTNFATITGGSGGQSHLQGGAGAAGVSVASSANLYNNGVIKGGDSSFAFAASGATALAGGDGIVLTGGLAVNHGTITGGLGGFVYASNGTGGAGGAGAYVNGGTLTNAGTISGGAGRTGGAQGDAVQFGTHASTLVDEAGSVFNGLVAGHGNDTLALDGYGGTLDGFGTQFTGFAQLTETAIASWTLASNVTGMAGAYGAAAGGAGAAGIIGQSGAIFSSTLTNLGTLTGGAGGQSHLQGGAGGSGADFVQGGTLTNNGVIKGGDSSFAFAASGATALAGGDGVVLGRGVVATNHGTITGGLGGFVYASNGTGGAGGAGAYVNGGTLVNFGTISGGAGRTGGAQGDAVQFGTAASTLVDEAGSVFNGLVAGHGNDTLDLTGTSGTLDGFGTQFTSFSALSITSGANWLVSGNNAGLAGGVDIYGFAGGDTLDLTGIAASTASFASNVLDLFNNTGTLVAALNIIDSTHTSADFTLSSDGTGGTDITLCFYSGTRLATPDGEIAVEHIRPGTLLRTAGGKSLPVRWLGRSEISTRFADPLRALPVRIRAGALGNGLPHRDLLVSPDHAMFIENILIQAAALVNGTSIIRETNVPERFTYYHVELASHELLLAEGAKTESFVDNVDRMHFTNWLEHEALPGVPPIEEMPFPRAKSHRQVPARIHQMLKQLGEKLIPPAAA